tara:strand:- start:63 stop:980 length:918 start_codon:yes stop_codon:yes gene_type:complete
MAWKKNASGGAQYYYKPKKSTSKTIQKDWLKEHGYKQGHFPPEFFENIEKNLTPGRLGYWAYAIDGDGCVSLTRGTQVDVRIPLNDPEPVQQLSDIYGSSISLTEYPEENWAPTYTTRLTGERGLHFLRLICPYMTEKRKKATQYINMIDPNYHPPKISMNFRQNSELLNPHMGMVGGFFDTEGSVGMRIQKVKYKTKKFGDRFCTSLREWVTFTNTDLRPLRKIKKILETWPFNFKPSIYINKNKNINKVGKPNKIKYILQIPKPQHLLFMKMFSPWILITRKREYADKFEHKKQIYKLYDENK